MLQTIFWKSSLHMNVFVFFQYWTCGIWITLVSTSYAVVELCFSGRDLDIMLCSSLLDDLIQFSTLNLTDFVPL